MKRHLCAAVGVALLALAGAGNAAADGLPLLGQTQVGSQSVSYGDQTVGEQKNDADVEQSQGNGNINVSPAISIGGDASTWNAQGNGNNADATVIQANEATQSQRSSQRQGLEQSGGSCCAGLSQTGEQSTDFGDQTVEKQSNDADVTQKQGNDNVNRSPAYAHGGDAATWNAQGNGNSADATVIQANEATQSQSSKQWQGQSQKGGDCCKPRHGDGKKDDHGKKWDHGKKDDERRCCDGKSQAGEQKADFGDQKVEKQWNEAEVSQEQGNENENLSPARAFGGHDRGSCSKHEKGTCKGNGKSKPAYGAHGGHGGDATASNAQGNGNEASASVVQGNAASQSQQSAQWQGLVQRCREVVRR